MTLTAEFAASDLPVIRTEEVPECPVCTKRDYTPFAVGFDYELRTCKNAWRFVQCVMCQHVWLHPRPAATELAVIYPKTYYSYSYEDQVHPVALRAKGLLDRWKLDGIVRSLSAPPRRYLDVGCGSGRFLRAMEARGLARRDVFGLELDPGVVARLHEEGFRAYSDPVERCEAIQEGSLDLITMFHVIEHVSDPSNVLRKLASWLSADGVLALETPNLDSTDARLFKDTFWGGYHIPRHFHVFTPESLSRLLVQCGFEVQFIRYQTGHSFWMYSLHHRLRYGERRAPALARKFDPFGGSLPMLAFFTGLDKVRAALRLRTSAMLVIARRR